MELALIVHGFVEEQTTKMVVVDGVEVPASVPGATVELVTPDGSMSFTLRIGPKDLEEAKALFGSAEPILMNLSAAK